jgi:hypothetical protein
MTAATGIDAVSHALAEAAKHQRTEEDLTRRERQLADARRFDRQPTVFELRDDVLSCGDPWFGSLDISRGSFFGDGHLASLPPRNRYDKHTVTSSGYETLGPRAIRKLTGKPLTLV